MKKLFLFIILFTLVYNSKAQLYINEILTSNTQINYDPDYTGFSDWIEIYNSGISDVNLNEYFISDDTINITKWQLPSVIVPANSYLLIWADGIAQGIHTNFKLSKNGEIISLYSPSSVLIDRISYPPQKANISYGRDFNNITNWVFFDKPTPAVQNNTNFVASLVFTSDVVFSENGGVYSSPQTISLSTSSPTAEIYYTTNGDIPTENSNLYTSPIFLDTTTIIRAACFKTGLLQSKVITNTYFFGINHTLPIISLTTAPRNLWNDTIGIYCVGTNGETNYGTTANYWNDWERPANFELYETNNQQVLNQKSGIAINGARRNMHQKSLRVFARNKYDNPSFDYKIFTDKNIKSFSSLVLRNGGLPDFENSMIRDGLTQTLINRVTDIDHQGSRQAVLYLNGKYWGIYNIKEKQNEDYLVSNHNVNPDNIDVLENFKNEIIPISGYDNDYKFLLNYIQNTDLNTEKAYLYLERVIDIEEYIDYLATEIYLGNYDWPYINMKYWKENNEKGKWRWLLFDTDPCMGLWGEPDYNSVHHALETEQTAWPNSFTSTLFFRSMLRSDKFKNEFIQCFAARINTIFTPERINHFADSMSANIAAEMINHIARWKDYDSPDGTCVQTIEEWNAAIENIKWFANVRESYIKQYVIEEFNLDGLFNLTTQSSNGYITINDAKISEGINQGTYFSNVPIRFKAIPNPGYKFVRWEGVSSETNDEITMNLEDASTITAVFEPTNYTILPNNITANDTLFLSQSPYLALHDLVVDSFASLTIEAGVQIYMNKNTGVYVYGKLITNGTQTNFVKIQNYAEAGFDNWDALCFYNATDTSYLNYLKLRNTSTGHNAELQNSALSSFNSHIRIVGLDVDNCLRPFYALQGSAHISDSKLRCEEICDLIHIEASADAIVENCDLLGSEAVDVDGVDFDNVTNGIIRNCKIYALSGFNSDGIDAGEQCSNILITENEIFNCNDKGISVGQQSTVIAKNNIIYNCGTGIGIKDSLSYANIINNTFYNNGYAVACFEKNYGAGGGSADIVNTILASSIISSVYVDNNLYSNANISYCLSDIETLIGSNNLFANPQFVNAMQFNLELMTTSPCIDAGNPTTPPDSDGTIADIGAKYIFQSNLLDTAIVVNEINYLSYPLDDAGDWFEIYNRTSTDVDLSGWVFMDGNNEHMYKFPENLILKANKYLVISNNKSLFNAVYPEITDFRAEFNFSLSDNGEPIRIYNAKMQLVDFVEYSSSAPWPANTASSGQTIALLSADLDNALPQNWCASEYLGTPAKANAYDYITNVLNDNFVKIYPNPAKDYIKIDISDIALSQTIYIYDMFGKIIKQIVPNYYESKILVDIKNMQKGIYIIKIGENSSKFVKL